VCLCYIAVAAVALQEGSSSHLWVQLCAAQKISCQVPPQTWYALIAAAAAAAAAALAAAAATAESKMFAAVFLWFERSGAKKEETKKYPKKSGWEHAVPKSFGLLACRGNSRSSS
jgi:sugar (pentulose or hexulose) kinase